MSARQWWIHGSKFQNLETEDWFVPVHISNRDMWEKDTNTVRVIEYEPIRMEMIKLECEIARLNNLLMETAPRGEGVGE